MEATVDISALLDDFETMLEDMETGTLAEVTTLGMLDVCAAISMLDDNSSSVLVDASTELETASETDSILEATVDISALLDDIISAVRNELVTIVVSEVDGITGEEPNKVGSTLVGKSVLIIPVEKVS